MEALPPKVREGSLLHRITGITPGYAPNWFCSRNSCEGFDLLAGVQIGGAYAGFFLGVACFALVGATIGVCACGGTLFVWLVVAVLAEGFVYRERFGRARLHRGECVWCGRPDTAPRTLCPTCTRHT